MKLVDIERVGTIDLHKLAAVSVMTYSHVSGAYVFTIHFTEGGNLVVSNFSDIELVDIRVDLVKAWKNA